MKVKPRQARRNVLSASHADIAQTCRRSVWLQLWRRQYRRNVSCQP